MTYCTFEDRESSHLALKLLCSSLSRWAGAFRLVIFFSGVKGALEQLPRQFPGVEVRAYHGSFHGYSVKPDLLLRLLDETGGPVAWFDSDLLFLRDPAPFLCVEKRETLVAVEEVGSVGSGDPRRTSVWDLPVARRLLRELNSCILRVDGGHESLLRTWRDLLASPQFLAAQRVPWPERDRALFGDQDVLEGLLCADTPAGYAKIPVRFLRSGAEVVHEKSFFSYTVPERLANACGWHRPLALHAMGPKPWLNMGARSMMEGHSYVCGARTHRADLTPDEAEFLNVRELTGWVSTHVLADNPHLSGLVWRGACVAAKALGMRKKPAPARIA